MNIQQLIKDLCPKGLERHALGEVGYFFGGVTGKSKKDFENGNSKFITYMNVFSNPKLKIDVKETVFINEGEKQNTLQYGDVLFTTSSETAEESGMSSVLITETNEKLYLNSFCFGFRFNSLENINPNFYSYIFRSEDLRKQIVKCANGVTRFNISKERFAKITIPIPPISIQNRIVEILDHFTDLISNLNSELDLRRKQLEHYLDVYYGENEEDMNKIAKAKGIEIKQLLDLGTLTRGRRFVRDDIRTEGVPCIHYGDMYTTYGVAENTTITFLDEDKANKLRFAEPNDVVIVGAGENDWDIGVGLAWLGSEKVVVHDACYIYKHSMDPKFVAYYLRSNNYHLQIRKWVSSGKISAISDRDLGKAKLPHYPIDTQKTIVSALDKFTALISNIEEEIKLRQKQYEYYREQLLTF